MPVIHLMQLFNELLRDGKRGGDYVLIKGATIFITISKMILFTKTTKLI